MPGADLVRRQTPSNCRFSRPFGYCHRAAQAADHLTDSGFLPPTDSVRSRVRPWVFGPVPRVNFQSGYAAIADSRSARRGISVAWCVVFQSSCSREAPNRRPPTKYEHTVASDVDPPSMIWRAEVPEKPGNDAQDTQPQRPNDVSKGSLGFSEIPDVAYEQDRDDDEREKQACCGKGLRPWETDQRKPSITPTIGLKS